jgi:hypothetical protein
VRQGSDGFVVHEVPTGQATQLPLQQTPAGQGMPFAAQTMQLPVSSHVPFVPQGKLRGRRLMPSAQLPVAPEQSITPTWQGFGFVVQGPPGSQF